jgi:hypothetical protein
VSVLQPSGLWFLLALPAIFILYLIQSRYRPQVVASLLLWKRMARDLEAEAAWRRPRWDLLLALQLLVALLAGLALARPAISAGGNQSLVLVLDTSASMAARDVQPTRFTAAKQQIADVVNSAAPDARISLVTAGVQPRVVVVDGSSANVLGALDPLQTEADSGDLASAVTVAAGLAAPQAANNSQVVAVTDGAAGLALPSQAVPVTFKLVGGAAQNLAVSDVSLRHPVESKDYLAGYVRVVNFGADTQSSTLAILADGKLIDRSPVDIPASGHSEATFRVPADAQNLSVGLADRGPLPADDRVDLVGYARWSRKVTIVSDTPVNWEHVLSVVPNVVTRSIGIPDYSSADASADDIYLFDNYVPTDLPRSALILVNPPDSSTFVLTRTDTLQRQRRAVSFDTQDPLLLGVDIAPLNVQQLERAQTPAWAAASVAAEDTPLILHGYFADQRAVVFAFDPNKSNLPHLAAFPLLMANAIDWLTPGRLAVLQGGLGNRTDIQPRPIADLAASTAATPAQSTMELWPWLIAAVVVFFALEWAVALRRG